ncbi:hypothetical protein ACFLT7_04865 [candidate division KSB1 bacterium]
MEWFGLNFHTTALIILFVILVILFLSINRKLSKMIVGSPIFNSRVKEISDNLDHRLTETDNMMTEIKELFESNVADFEEIRAMVQKIVDMNSKKVENAQKYMTDYEESKRKTF